VQTSGLRHISSAGFANLYGVHWGTQQLKDARSHLNKCKHSAVCDGLRRDVAGLEAKMIREWGREDRCFGMDFVVVATAGAGKE